MGVQSQLFPGDPKQIECICRIVDAKAAEAGFDERTRYACQLATAEACENIIKHGYGMTGSGTIEITTTASKGVLLIELKDNGPPFNPVNSGNPPQLDIENPPVGGLGLLIIQRVMDEITYQRSSSANVLRLLKRGNLPGG
jgi:serine/threonine-protein kinase RsbW